MGQILAMRRTVTAMDDKTISLKDAMDTINQICNDDCYHIGHEGRCYKDCGLNKVRKALEALPPAQPEIVRCKGCKWSYDDVSGRICSHGVCVDCVVSDDFYCADAERRTDGSD